MLRVGWERKSGVLRRFGVQTIARFFDDIPVSDLRSDTRCRWSSKCLRVLKLL
jgi:hypothetical protein